MRVINGWGHGVWKKALRQGGAVVCAAIITNITDPTVPLYSLAWFRHVGIACVTTFLLCELAYTKNWLSSNGNGSGNGDTKGDSVKPAIILLLTVSLALAGCPKLERTVYDAAIGGKATIDSIEAAHPECEKGPSQFCDKLARAANAQRLLVEAGKVYCANAEFMQNGGACHPPKKGDPAYQVAVDKLQAALHEYEDAEAALKGAIR